jgi:FixJ family two-component response regulator
MTSNPKRTVLVVDDDASLLRALQRLLQELHLEVLTFSSAEAFLASEIPDGDVCLLIDVYLPGMSGIELCKRLAASDRSLPTIVMSAHDDEVTQRNARQAGAVATLYKPFDEDVLLNALTRALGCEVAGC